MDTPARRLLATMPLHAITSAYGEDGLRELIALPDTPLGAPARERILTQLGQAADRFAAILPADGPGAATRSRDP